MKRTMAVADIGGTHARFALAEVEGGSVASLGEAATFRTSDFEGLSSAWSEFGKVAGSPLPDALAIAFAGPIGSKALKLTNSQWVIEPGRLHKQLRVSDVTMVNDFGAIAHAVAQLGQDQFQHCCGPNMPLPESGPITVIGPGTGLGVAQLMRTAGDYQVIETEGGHIDFAPLDPLEDRLLAVLRQRFERVSVERIVSGSGLSNLYTALAAIEAKDAPLLENEAIWTAALDGSDPLAVAALERFFLSFGSVAGDLALAHGSKAVVIAGGLGYRLRQQMAASGFAERFVAKGRFREQMETIPVKLLDHPQPGLYGAAAAYAKEHQ
ncbi:glucokinase [Sphingomonas sp. NSE70-1]|uniref:Glucokinase n=1 Tax=Sphingomonas caseinilyticus TaxID=2908205 RepID=A0ABT0RTP4_9SPHN|nr:glucokinase [Sphingomonas caseinilyticus]MCL6698364.1 glucokinase [Sphingomonas caseinilyticus]